MKKHSKQDIQEWLLKRKLRKQMMKVLKSDYGYDIGTLSREKVFGQKAIERLLEVYIIGMANRNFAEFHGMVKPFSRNIDVKLRNWYEVLSSDGLLLKNRLVRQMCNPMFQSYCDLYLDTDENCYKLNVCLVQLLGIEEMMRRCKHVGLDVEYEMVYNRVMETINNKENMNE